MTDAEFDEVARLLDEASKDLHVASVHMVAHGLTEQFRNKLGDANANIERAMAMLPKMDDDKDGG